MQIQAKNGGRLKLCHFSRNTQRLAGELAVTHREPFGLAQQLDDLVVPPPKASSNALLMFSALVPGSAMPPDQQSRCGIVHQAIE